MAPAKDTKIKGHGNLTVSNVNSPNSECRTLTYTIFNIKKLEDVPAILKKCARAHDEEQSVDLQISGFGEKDPKITAKLKIKSCDDEELAHEVKKKLDACIRKIGGQTTLDEEGI